MLPAANSILNSLIDSLAPEKKTGFLQYLSDKDRLDLEKNPGVAIDLPLKPQSKIKVLHSVHYSWFIPIIKSYSINSHYFLPALTKTQVKKIAPHLNDISQEEITPLAQKYFSNLLLYSLIGEKNDLLDSKFLPPSRLNVLLSLTKEQIVSVIDYLGLYDLAKIIFQIVDPKALKMIEQSLSKKKRVFLQSILQKKHPLSFPPLQWDKKPESLASTVHKRGLLRFSKAFCFQHNDFLWYISHKLDVGRGNTLIKQSQTKIDAKMSDLLIDDILSILSYLQLANPMEQS